MPSMVPSPYAIVHIARTVSAEEDPDTGNDVIIDQLPVVRLVHGISQIGRMRGSSKEVFSGEFLKRVDTDLHISCDNPSIYGPLDQIILFPEIDDFGDWVPGT